MVRALLRGGIGLATALLIAPAADALNITGLTVTLGGSNTINNTTNTGNNRNQETSATSITLSPLAAPDTVGSLSEFITRYAMLVAADRTNTTANTLANMTSSYSITFTVDNPTGATVQVDIDTLRIGSLTSITDGAGNSTITLGAITGQLDAVTQAGLALASATQTVSADGDSPFNQAGTISFVTSSVSSTYVLQFDWTSSVNSAQDGAAIRMGLPGAITTTTADDYPGVTFPRTQSNDGHFVDVTATIISVPEPASGALVALGLLGLAMRARRVRAERR